MPAHVRAFDAVVLAGGRSTRLGGADKPGLVVGRRTLLGSVVWAVTEAGAARVVVVGPQRPAALGAAILTPGTGSPGTGGAGTGSPRTGSPGTGSPGTGGAGTGSPGTGSPGMGSPGTGSPGTGSPGMGSPGTGGPGARGGEQVRYTREDPSGGGPVAALRCGLAEVTAPDVVLLAADLPFLRPVHVTRLLAALAGPAARGVALLDVSGRPQWLASGWPAAVLRAALEDYPGSSLRGVLGPLEPVLLPDETAAGEPPPWLDCDTADDLRVARDWAARAGTEQEATR
jgi:molybdopterin-guanine dinucleotide biosynthesis protein A